MFEESNSGQAIVGNDGSVVLIRPVVILWWRFHRGNWRNQLSEHENTARVAQRSVPIDVETDQSSFLVLTASFGVSCLVVKCLRGCGFKVGHEPKVGIAAEGECRRDSTYLPHFTPANITQSTCLQHLSQTCAHSIILPTHPRWLKMRH